MSFGLEFKKVKRTGFILPFSVEVFYDYSTNSQYASSFRKLCRI